MLKLNNFCPINQWHEVEVEGGRFADGRPAFIEDDDGQRFINYKSSSIRKACAVQLVVAPILLAGITGLTLFRTMFLVDLFLPQEPAQSLKERGLVVLGNAARVLASPLTLVALEISAVWGLVRPRDGQKLISNIISLGMEKQSVSQSSILKTLRLGQYDQATAEERRSLLPSYLGHLADSKWSAISQHDRGLILLNCPYLVGQDLARRDVLTASVVENAMSSSLSILFDRVID